MRFVWARLITSATTINLHNSSSWPCHLIAYQQVLMPLMFPLTVSTNSLICMSWPYSISWSTSFFLIRNQSSILGLFIIKRALLKCYWLVGLSQYHWNSFSHNFQSSYSSTCSPVAWTPRSSTGGKDKNGTEENLRNWKLIVKDRDCNWIGTWQSLQTLSNQHLPIILHDTMVKWVDKFIFLGIKISSDRKMYDMVSRET